MIDLIRLGFEAIGVATVGLLLLASVLQWRDRIAAEKAEGTGEKCRIAVEPDRRSQCSTNSPQTA